MFGAISLRNECLEALVLPHIGGGLARLDWIAAAQRIPLMRPLATNFINPDPNELACYPMLPWCNRIGAGRFEFNGTLHHIAPNRSDEPCPIHGDGWLSPWSVVERSPVSLTLEFDKNGAGPFIYRGTLSYALEPSALSMKLSVQNRGADVMPFGLGLHPWFVRAPHTEVHATTSGLWEAGEDRLPVTRKSINSLGARSPLHVSPGITIDNAFFGWDGLALIRWPEYNMALRLDTEPTLSHFVFYAPLAKPFFCLEPVTHPINALNLPEPHRREGVVALQPGESMSIKLRAKALPSG